MLVSRICSKISDSLLSVALRSQRRRQPTGGVLECGNRRKKPRTSIDRPHHVKPQRDDALFSTASNQAEKMDRRHRNNSCDALVLYVRAGQPELVV